MVALLCQYSGDEDTIATLHRSSAAIHSPRVARAAGSADKISLVPGNTSEITRLGYCEFPFSPSPHSREPELSGV